MEEVKEGRRGRVSNTGQQEEVREFRLEAGYGLDRRRVMLKKAREEAGDS